VWFVLAVAVEKCYSISGYLYILPEDDDIKKLSFQIQIEVLRFLGVFSESKLKNDST
jgi:hypothetical protein